MVALFALAVLYALPAIAPRAVVQDLFGILTRTDDHSMAALPDTAIMKRWWAHMADIMEVRPDNEPVATPLVTVFHMP